ncbi:MAG: group I intron-associated PD-(D/E)XK endonuclease [Candidatus Sulfotelmatobacter sp.]|jgi:hypothetical protein
MKKRKPRIIKDKKMRGEWAESVFMGRASEHELPVSKPWGDSESFDCVVGRPGKFLAVQVKCTISELRNGQGYACSTCSSGKPYRSGAFDFLAAYVVPEDAWYIIPAKAIRGMKSISLLTQGGKYEGYREAWHLLREAAEVGEASESGAEEAGAQVATSGRFPTNAVERMEAAANFARRCLEGNYPRPQKEPEDG